MKSFSCTRTIPALVGLALLGLGVVAVTIAARRTQAA